MKPLFTIILILSGFCIYSQDTITEYNCGWNKTLSVKERNALFPFSEAKKVILISYPNHELFSQVDDDSLSIKDAAKYYKTSIKNKWVLNKVLTDKVYFSKEEVILNNEARNKLSNLLYNYTNQDQVGSIVLGSLCYTPRNSILFLNNEQEVIACLEICFECMKVNFIKTENNTFQEFIFDGCIEKFELLRKFFIEHKVNYGTN